MTRQARHIPSAHRRAFTMVEVIVAVIMLGVVAGLVAPRMLSTQSRRAESNARQVAALVSTAAQRDALGSERVAIRYEAPDPNVAGQTPVLRLQVLRWLDDGSRFGIIQWRDDPFVQPVELVDVELTEVLVEGQFPSDESWFLDFPVGEIRPAIELVVQARSDRRGGKRWWIGLASHESSARFVEVRGNELETNEIEPIDLDALGLGDRPW